MEARRTGCFVTLAILLIFASQAVRNWFGCTMIVCLSVRKQLENHSADFHRLLMLWSFAEICSQFSIFGQDLKNIYGH